MLEKQAPRLFIIVTDGPLMVGKPSKLGSRIAIHTEVASPPLPPAAIAVSISTGVSALQHGIVTRGTVDAVTYKIREAERSDRRAQSFWDGSEFTIKTINWPAILGDERVENMQSSDEFADISSCLNADVVGVVFPRLARESTEASQVQETQSKVEKLIESIDEATHFLIVSHRTNDDASVMKSIRPYAATFLVGSQSYDIAEIPHLELIGGAAYALAGVSCPIGVIQPEWKFLKPYLVDEPRTFPQIPSNTDAEWVAVLEHVIAEQYKPGITILIQRFLTLASIAFKKELWKELELNSAFLVQLRGKPFDYWMLILALEQQGKMESLQSVVQLLEKAYPDIPLTIIAQGLIQLNLDNPVDKLESINLDKLAVFHAIGTYGRLCLKAGLVEQGVEALHRSLQLGVFTSADRAKLANYYYEQEEYDEGLRVLREVGLNRGELTWQVLRLKLLISLNQSDAAIRQASLVLEQDSTHSVALHALELFG